MKRFLLLCYAIAHIGLGGMEREDQQHNDNDADVFNDLTVDLQFGESDETRLVPFSNVATFDTIADCVRNYMEECDQEAAIQQNRVISTPICCLGEIDHDTFATLINISNGSLSLEDIPLEDFQKIIYGAAYLGASRADRYAIENAYTKRIVDDVDTETYTERKELLTGFDHSTGTSLLTSHVAPLLSTAYTLVKSAHAGPDWQVIHLACNPKNANEYALYSWNPKEPMAAINLWNLDPFAQQQRAKMNAQQWINANSLKLLYSQDGSTLFFTKPDGKSVSSWSIKDRKVRRKKTLKDGQAQGITLSAYNSIVSYTSGTNIRCIARHHLTDGWDAVALAKENKLHIRQELINDKGENSSEILKISNFGHAINHIAFNKNGSLLLVQSGDTRFTAYDCSTYSNIARFGAREIKPLLCPPGAPAPTGTKPHYLPIKCIKFHPRKHDLFASGACDTTIKLWDARRGICLATVGTHENSAVMALDFTPSGELLISGAQDGTIKMWRAQSPIKRLEMLPLAYFMISNRLKNDYDLAPYRALKADYESLDEEERKAIRERIEGRND